MLGSGWHPSPHCLPFSVHTLSTGSSLTHPLHTQQNFHMVHENRYAVGPFTSHAPAFSAFGCCVVCPCPHALGGLERQVWGQKEFCCWWAQTSSLVKSLKYSAHHSNPTKNVPFHYFYSLPFLLWAVMALPVCLPFFITPNPLPVVHLSEDFQNSCSSGVDVVS